MRELLIAPRIYPNKGELSSVIEPSINLPLIEELGQTLVSKEKRFTSSDKCLPLRIDFSYID